MPLITKSIVLEGPDNTGKSTLARLLAGKLSLPLFKAGPSPKSNELLRLCCEYQIAWMRERQCVFDRVSFISQQCYHFMNPYEREKLRKYIDIMIQHSVVIYCCETLGKSRDTYETEEDDSIVEANKGLVKSRYDRIMDRLPHVEYRGESLNHVTGLILWNN